MYLNRIMLEEIIHRAINEDLGIGDITTDNLINSEQWSSAVIRGKERGIVAGIDVARMIFEEYNKKIKFRPIINDGYLMKNGEVIIELEGPTGDIIKAERIALNFMQRMSGIATKTFRLVELVKDYKTEIVDTRKTTPTLRILEKYAVSIGGGRNHRMGLYDAVIIKDNHIKAVGGIEKAVNMIKTKIPHTIKIEVEVENILGVDEALKAGADIIMLDNMDVELMAEAVLRIDGRAVTEASGGIKEENLIEVARSGVDIISIGELTHHIKSLDISLDLKY
jgi:nicotinate-nucleotide pyrophosphorylase (carboxylating)